MQVGVVDGVCYVQLEVLTLPDLMHPFEAQPGQRACDRLTLRVKDLRFQDHVDDHSCHATEATGSPEIYGIASAGEAEPLSAWQADG